MTAFLISLPSMLKETALEWMHDNAMRLAASLSYYTAFSLVPMWLAIITIAGMIFGEDAASGQLFQQLRDTVGPSAAKALEDLTQAASKPASGTFSTIVAMAIALFGAAGVFGELKESLNQIWGMSSTQGSGIWSWVKGRFLSIGMVMGVCFLLLVSISISSFLTLLSENGLDDVPGSAILMQIVNQVLTLGVITVLFSAMFRYLPETRIAWRDVWTGGAVTAVLFVIGKFGLEQYISHASPADAFGAASSLALVLVWVYYSSQIFLFGAEFTEVYARRHGSRRNRPAPRSIDRPNLAADPEAPEDPCD